MTEALRDDVTSAIHGVLHDDGTDDTVNDFVTDLVDAIMPLLVAIPHSKDLDIIND